MDTMIESRLDSLERQISALEENQKSLINQGAYGEDQGEIQAGGASIFEIQYSYSGNQVSLPIQSSFILPEGLRAENISGSTVIMHIEKPKFSLNSEDMQNLDILYFDFFISVGAILFLALFAYYILSYFFYSLFSKKNGL